MPTFRQYPEALSVQTTDAFIIDRIGVGSMYVKAQELGNKIAIYNSGALLTDSVSSVDFTHGLSASNVGTSVTVVPIRCITYIIDGGGSTISTGIAGQLFIPFGCVITEATLLADQSGSVVVDIWKAAYSSYPPNSGNSIVAAAPPTISTAQKSQNSTLTGWTTAITAGDTLMFNVNSVTSITRLTVALTVS